MEEINLSFQSISPTLFIVLSAVLKGLEVLFCKLLFFYTHQSFVCDQTLIKEFSIRHLSSFQFTKLRGRLVTTFDGNGRPD